MKIRIAIAIETDGRWSAYGRSDMPECGEDSVAHRALEGLSTLDGPWSDAAQAGIRWIEVDI